MGNVCGVLLGRVRTGAPQGKGEDERGEGGGSAWAAQCPTTSFTFTFTSAHTAQQSRKIHGECDVSEWVVSACCIKRGKTGHPSATNAKHYWDRTRVTIVFRRALRSVQV